jgi:hypothetical protein
MSWRKIEKVWDEVRAAQEPKRNLSKQPKKSRETKLSTKDEVYDALTWAFDNQYLIKDIEKLTSVMEVAVSNLKSAGVEYTMLNTYIVEDYQEIINEKGDELQKKASELGVDIEDILKDYTKGDISSADSICKNLVKAIQDFSDSTEDMRKIVKDLEE